MVPPGSNPTVVGRLLAAYTSALSRYVLLQPAVSAGLATSADLVAQTVGEGCELKDVDWRRTSAFSVFGCFYSGMFIPRWFAAVSSGVHRTLAGRPRAVQAAAKVAVDMGLQAPFSYMPVFYYSTGLWRGDDLDTITQRFREKWRDSTLGAWSVMVPAMYVNFLYVPPPLRVVFANSCSFGWTIALSLYVNARGEAGEAPASLPVQPQALALPAAPSTREDRCDARQAEQKKSAP